MLGKLLLVSTVALIALTSSISYVTVYGQHCLRLTALRLAGQTPFSLPLSETAR